MRSLLLSDDGRIPMTVAVFLLAAGLAGAETGNTATRPVGAEAAGDEYARKSDVGMKFSGDMRVRFDVLFRSDEVARPRLRARLRVGAKGTLAEGRVNWGVRLATNPGDAVSRNLTIAGGDNNAAPQSFGLDQVYLGFSPHPDVQITVGKAAYPFWTSETIFDGDLTPEGLTLRWDLHRGQEGDTVRNVRNTFALYPIREAGPITNDPFALLNQFQADVGAVQLGLGFFYYGGLNARAAGSPGASGMGQAANQLFPTGHPQAGMFAEDQFGVLHTKLYYPFQAGNVSLGLGGEFFANVLVDSQLLGYEVRLDAPKLGPGRGTLLWREVQQNATFSPWSDSDLGEGTGYRAGIEASYEVPVVPGVDFEVSFFRFDANRPQADGLVRTTNRLFLDIKGKF